ncbi:MAG: asparagine synthase (glutamine-hydrolyzing) [Bacteroidia bacterium]|nr:asparagine synthase (glutamine-hydrolyzing) [Bacteroidia bacterium]
MCGIAGMFGRSDERQLRVMTQMLRHRGPDGGAVWFGDDVGFGHRRLKIIDLSEAAAQPMLSADGRCALTFNGEIFNYRELRTQLRGLGYAFRTESDSEVLLAACMHWGQRVVEHLVGQFAFAYADAGSGLRMLVRDHLGVKPLYYAENGDTLYFASEAKAILAVLPGTREPDWRHFPKYLTFLWVPGEDTLFRDVRKLSPGSMLIERAGRWTVRSYWNPVETWLGAEQSTATEAERDEQLRVLLGEAVQSQLVSDVPLGLLLSGGLDSTILLSAMAGRGRTPEAITATYSSESRARDVFDDDLPYARSAAGAFGADLREALIDADVVSLLPEVLWQLDEPLADPTVITNFILTRQAKATHTVLLTGMGADEIFAGYPRYAATMLGEMLRTVPPGMTRFAARAVRWLVDKGVVPLEQARRPMQLLDQLDKPFEERYIGYSSYATSDTLRSLLSAQARHPGECGIVFDQHRELLRKSAKLSPLSRMLATDLMTFLPKLNLENMDKTSMAHAVEMRVPFLDHRLVEFAMTLPDSDKLGAKGERKAILRRAFANAIPDAILRRPKTGYSPPVRGWMRDSLREFTEDMLCSEDACSKDLFQPAELRRIMEENRTGKRDHSLQLWAILTFEVWLRSVAQRQDWTPPVDPKLLPVIQQPTRNETHE